MINYPFVYRYQSPTCATTLIICDQCMIARWSLLNGKSKYCCNARSREATPQEYMIALDEIQAELPKSRTGDLRKIVEKRFEE